MTTTSTELQDRLATRFLRYSAISTQSDSAATVVPSCQGQWEFARLLAVELEEAGVRDIHLSDTCVLTARIPSTLPDDVRAPVIGFCTHLDTADSGLSPIVNARIIEHTGGDIHLGEDQWIRRKEHPEIDAYVGQRILVTDGTSVLGADDKAGVASVMEAAVRLMADPMAHPEVYLAFVPDEEIGLRGVRTMDLARFPVDWAYTLDCCERGEVVEATFNAAYATVVIEGVAAHPMSAFGVLVNPILVAHDLIGRFDPTQTPECTQGREGYIWVDAMHADQSVATVDLNIRDFDRTRFEERKEQIRQIVDQVRAAHPRARIDVTFEDVYANLEDSKTPTNAIATRRLLDAMAAVGVEPIHRSMRGGTDGSWLSAQGIFTPNFFTGAHNFHSRCEFLPLPSLECSHRVVMELMRGASS
ncbi:peptidase T [Cutibacterium sp.]|uniref:peptidase T n=1 Tax=Cutibacterium sp. TaxID=1912221 RepID=UPI0026DB819B|nr:peptidase T [Cutibacterium sp.]MDO4413040.1 peptidase T [Cutibacterium sp.]